MSNKTPKKEQKVELTKDNLRFDKAGTAGPMWVNPEDKDPNFYYRFCNFSPDKPHKMEARLRAGYVLCTVDEFPSLRTDVLSGLFGNTAVEGNHIYKIVGPNTKAYLMKIPMDVYQARQAAKEQRRAQKESRQFDEMAHRYGFNFKG